ncbi:serine protease [Virgibacillus soli]
MSEDRDIIDEDLFEDIDEEEMYELLQQAKKEIEAKQQEGKPKRPFPKWAFWLISFAMFLQVIALLPQTLSIPAIDFLTTSAKLSKQEIIQSHKQAVVVIETDESRGTGFSITEDGKIITNAHVVKSNERVTVAFPEHGLFMADVIVSYPDIDLAVLQVEKGSALPTLELAEETLFVEGEQIQFIGNPLRFQGIANEGSILGYTKLRDWKEPVLMIQAPVYRGNSGSPIFNKAGQVIGVIFATLDHESYGKVGLFIPIDYYYKKIKEGV